MAFRSELKIDGKEIKLLHCSYALQRDTDPTGRPTSEVRGGTIQFEIESTDSTSFFEWMCNAYENKSGSVVFFKRDDKTTLKELKFDTAYLIEYSEAIDSVGDNPMVENFTLSAKKIEIGSGSHENEWPI